MFPDMTSDQVDSFRRSLDAVRIPSITVHNISEVVTVFPRRIAAYAGVNNRTFWEAECPSELNPEYRSKET